jgi:hypothetical protein
VSETKPKSNTYIWVAVIAAAIYWYNSNNKSAPGPTPDPVPSPNQLVQSVESILPTLKKEFRKIFAESAAKVESGEIKSDLQLFEFVNPATKAAREAANKPFDVQLDLSLPRNDDGTFSGKEKEAAALLRRIAESW